MNNIIFQRHILYVEPSVLNTEEEISFASP